ncbi:sulfotransferase family protein [Antarcticimicrobium luteum]|uniref:Sulfotransferase n=1 Tax=Antarcticimicrobium luteum TaxID=2547397 RepID=A0A4R5VDI6_9RHOB|nr:sulfotransferase [Antarcticimicrobium luteum]TDK50411.1 sulfotransferase [Antarcticimicrobium luteum]
MGRVRSILLAGCPRSGTSWIHFLLASHPDAITCRETHVYDKYVGPLKNWYDQEFVLEGNDGLGALFSEDEFVQEILAPIVEKTFDKIAADTQGKVVVEKTPGNMLWHHLIARIQPEARILFIIRDPRAVYASFKAASENAWGSWTRKGIEEFCRSWKEYATAYLAAKSYRSKDSLMCVRYEDMKMNGKKELTQIFDWAGLEAPEDVVDEALKNNTIASLKKSEPGTIQHDIRPGFYRKGNAYAWVDELSLNEIRQIETHCMNLMTIMGYNRHVPKK